MTLLLAQPESPTRSRRRILVGALAGIVLATAAVMLVAAPFERDPARAAQTTLTGGTVTIPAASNGFGNSYPFPSTVEVSGLAGKVIGVRVRFSPFTHSCFSDVDAMLVAPDGTKTLLIADSGGCGSTAATVVTFDDAATGSVPSPLTSGVYRPTGGTWSASSPTGTTNTQLSAFNGLSPNGSWKLYVYDDALNDEGTIGSWDLMLTTGTVPQNTVAPRVTGSAVVGSTVHVNSGTWTGDPTPTITYQWQRCTHGNCYPTSIAGATGSDYTLTGEDVGKDVWVAVTGTNAAGHVTVGSYGIGPVQPTGGAYDPCAEDPYSEECLSWKEDYTGESDSDREPGEEGGKLAPLTIGAGVLHMKRGKVAVKVSCPSSRRSGCNTGTLAIRTAKKVSASSKKYVTLARGSFDRIGAGKTATIKTRVSKRNQRLVKKLRQVQVNVTITLGRDAETAERFVTATKLKAR